jgi:predicted GIY-YIG superfamily endonuclease
MKGYVYLLHFSQPLAPGCAQHYIGWTLDLDKRIRQHRQGVGARVTQVAIERGIALRVVEVWCGSRRLERRIKSARNHRIFCPVCSKPITHVA